MTPIGLGNLVERLSMVSETICQAALQHLDIGLLKRPVHVTLFQGAETETLRMI